MTSLLSETNSEAFKSLGVTVVGGNSLPPPLDRCSSVHAAVFPWVWFMNWRWVHALPGAPATQTCCVTTCWAGLAWFEGAGLAEVMVPSNAEALLYCGEGC